jgi:hypothetical protein
MARAGLDLLDARSLITSRRSVGRDLGRYSAVSLAVPEPFLDPNGRKFGVLVARNAYYLTADGAPVGPFITSIHQRAAPATKHRKNTEFRTILEMGLREAYLGVPSRIPHTRPSRTPARSILPLY